MKIYWVADAYENDIWSTNFYANKEDAQKEVDRRITKLHEEEAIRYNRALQKWITDTEAVKALRKMKIPIPAGLSWTAAAPEKRTVFSHGLVVGEIDVIE